MLIWKLFYIISYRFYPQPDWIRSASLMQIKTEFLPPDSVIEARLRNV